jgi:hypothetical protein
MIAMPTPIPLDPPSERPGELDDLVEQVAGAARWLADVDGRLVGAAASAPGWLGDDAAAASDQIGAVTALVRTASDALLLVVGRLTGHADRVLTAHRQVEALLEEQDEHFREGWRRWYAIPDLQLQLMAGGPDVRAVVEDVEAGEGSRRRRHHLVLEDLTDDASATARALVDACAAVGVRGRAGGANTVVAYLAAELPGWGDLELARQGRVLAGRLTQGTPEQRTTLAAEAAIFAAHGAFANALLTSLGIVGFTYLLDFLDSNALGPDNSVARLLAAALGAAVPSGRSDDPVAGVLQGEYVRTDDRNGSSDRVAAGLATVLAAGSNLPSGGVPTRTVGEWSRQLLLREHEQRRPVGRRSLPGTPEVADPAALAIGILADRTDPAVSAALLDDPHVWQALMRRVWGDGGTALADVITQAGREQGAPGDRALRTGLSTVGAGLAAGDPADWAVNRDTLAAVAPALGDAVAAHVDVAVEALRVGVDGQPAAHQADTVVGLGYVTLDRDAAAAIERALTGWAQVDPAALDGTTPEAPLPAVGVLSAYVAVRQYAQRADHALDALEDRETAENKELLWQHSVHLVPELIPGCGGIVAGLVEGYAAIALDMDGTWDDRADRGLVFDSTDAAVLALTTVAPQEGTAVRAVVDQATAAFDRTAAVLGERRAPVSPETDWLEPFEDLGIDFQNERMQRENRWRGRRPRLP